MLIIKTENAKEFAESLVGDDSQFEGVFIPYFAKDVERDLDEILANFSVYKITLNIPEEQSNG